MKNQTNFLMLLAAAFMLFPSCEKSEMPFDTPVQTGQNDRALHALAKLLVGDLSSSGELLQKQLGLFHETGVEEFLLVDFLEAGIGFRSPNIITDLVSQNPLMEVRYPSFAFFDTIETFEQHITNIQYYVVIEEGVDPESASVDSLSAYDANGNPLRIPNVFDKNVRYAVVAMDEGHDAFVGDANVSVKGVTKPASLNNFTPSSVSGNVKYYEGATISNAQVMDAGPVEFGPITFRGGDGPESDCDRPANKKDQLYKIRFSNKDAVKVIESGFRLPNVELKIT
jgi:hypothetical protein